MEHWSNLYGNDVITVSYEDFVENTAEMSTKVRHFLGLADAVTGSADADPDYEGRAIGRAQIGHARHYAAHLAEALGRFD